MNDYPPLVDEFVITEPETLKVLGDARRIQIIKALRKPRTVKEVAEVVGLPHTKLYYHINLLEQHDLIEVIDSNIVSGIIEKVYRATAGRLRVDEAVLAGPEPAGEHLEAMINAVFDDTKAQIGRAIRAGLMARSQDPDIRPRDTLTRTQARLTPEQFEVLLTKMQSLVQEFGELCEANKDSDLQEYGLLVTLYPLYESEAEE